MLSGPSRKFSVVLVEGSNGVSKLPVGTIQKDFLSADEPVLVAENGLSPAQG